MNPSKRTLLISLITVITLSGLYAQGKQALQLTDLMKFRQVQSPSISEDGSWVTHAAVPDRGDPEVFVYTTNGKITHVIPGAKNPVFSRDGNWIAAVRTVPAAELIKSKPDKEKKPKAGMVLLNTATGEQTPFDNVKSFKFSNDNKWLIYHSAKVGKSDSDKEKNGTTLHLMSLDQKSTTSLSFVTKYAMDSVSSHLAYVVADTNGMGNGVYTLNLSDPQSDAANLYRDSAAWADYLSWNNRTGQLAFLAGVTQEKEKKEETQLFLWSPGEKKATVALNDGDLADGWKIHHTNSLKWTIDGNRLFLGIKPISEIIQTEEEKPDSLMDLFSTEDILTGRTVDVWHWNDPYINPNQKKRWKTEKDRTYTGLFYPPEGKFISLANREMPELRISESDNYLLGSSNVPYATRVTWEGRINDYYLVDLKTGEKKLVVGEQEHTVSLSPDGKFLVYYSKGDWHLVKTSTLESKNLTETLDVSFADEDWDYPAENPGYRGVEWLDESKAVLLYDKYDIWQFSTTGDAPVCLTDGKGREVKYQYRVKKLNRDKRFLNPGETLYLTAYHDMKKHTALYSMKAGIPGVTPVFEEDKKYTLIASAKEADKLVFTRQSYTEFPDLWVTDSKFRKPLKLSDVNPQTANFAWGETELVEWSSMDGTPLQGILIKPGNYEPGKKYPVLVYYYRFFSNRLYDFNQVAVNHRPCFPYYASNGYAIFLPDIRFDIGNPGYSATKCLVPGVQKIIDMGVADPEAICLHGHSWSGYQTAFAITQTDMFTCAIAGAPVSNMTSAYSGIRWGTGLARQFQYEKSQSRIGGNLWESRDKYIENSPVFFADRINTPLLIMFGDVDDAVPWYQGIELYLAMRRLEKDCVFLQYRDEPHHPKKYANKLDYTIRFKEYLDHYLKGQPAPEWIETGVPYKGK